MNEVSKNRYPKMNPLLCYHYLYEDIFQLRNMISDEGWEVGKKVVDFLTQLDGEKDPYEIDLDLDEIDVEEILEVYEKNGWITKNSRLRKLGFSIGTPIVNNKIRMGARVWNILVTLLFLPVFGKGIISILQGYVRVEKGTCFLWGMVLAVILGNLLCEFSYAAASIVHNEARLIEGGFRLKYLVPSFYLCVDLKKIQSPLNRAHIKISKLKMNLLLAGTFLCLLKYQVFDSGVLFMAAVTNLVIAVLSLFFSTFDWIEIMGELLGTQLLVEKAKYVLMNMKKMKCRDVNELAIFLLSGIVMVFQLIIPLFLMVMIGFGWFV